MREIEEHKLSLRRLTYMSGVFVLFLGGTCVLAVQNRMLLDELFCTLIVDAVFFGIFAICLLRGRISGKTGYQGTDYSRLFVYMVLAWAVAIAGSYMPDFLLPVGFMAFIFCTYFTDAIALGMGLYFVTQICMLCGRGTYLIYCYCLLLVCNVFFAVYLREIQGRGRLLFATVLLLTGCANAFLPIVFYYFTFAKLDRQMMMQVGIEAVLLVGFAALFYLRLWNYNQRERAVALELLLEDDYPLLQELRKYSKVEYQHGRKVSHLAAVCGREIGADEQICAVGGLYYRIGKMTGPPEIDSAVKTVTNQCFPPAVIAILEEFEGKKRRPQTPESAIVQMVDALVTKIDLMDKDVMSSVWNESMVIYQTLNEFSNDGMYDEAELSMNQFLKVREKLVQEGIAA